MNLLLIGERYSPNLGDGIIFDTVEKICKKIYGDKTNIISFDISGGTSYSSKKNNGLKEKIKMKFPFLRKILSEIKRVSSVKKRIKSINLDKIDGAIFVGGQLFSEYFSKPIYVLCKELDKKKVPILFNCCGLGKNEKKKYINYLNNAFELKNVISISVRDNYDEFINKYKVDLKKVQLVVDPVVECSDYVCIKKQNRILYGIGIMDPKLYKKNGVIYGDDYYYNLYNAIIQKLDEKKIEWEFFCNGRVNDYDYAKKVCMALGISTKKVAERPTTPIELIRLINNYSNIISFRLHSHIVAYSYEIPTIGFCWDEKVKEFGRIINNEKFFLDLDDYVVENFNKVIDDFTKKKISKEVNYKLSSTFLKENKFGGK